MGTNGRGITENGVMQGGQGSVAGRARKKIEGSKETRPLLEGGEKDEG